MAAPHIIHSPGVRALQRVAARKEDPAEFVLQAQAYMILARAALRLLGDHQNADRAEDMLDGLQALGKELR